MRADQNKLGATDNNTPTEIEDAIIRTTGLFFFFALLDEAKAKKATLAVFSNVLRQKKIKSIDEKEWPSIVVMETFQYWNKIRKKEKSRTQGVLTFEAGFQIPGKMDFGFWQQFHRDASDDELIATIWSKILKFTDDDIAKGLGVTTGTVRHRLARGLRLFGSIVKVS